MKQIFRDITLPVVRYELSPQQLSAGKTFTPEQRWVISNMIEELIAERLSILFNPENQQQEILHDAACRGAIQILQELLTPAAVTPTQVSL